MEERNGFRRSNQGIERRRAGIAHGLERQGNVAPYSPGSPALPAANFWSPCNKAFAEQNGGTAEVLPCITMKTAGGKILMGWLASQTDMLSDDWGIVSN
jgi:hypothetical protein